MFNKLRDWSIQFKLLAMTAFLILCSVFSVTILSYFQYTQDFEKQSADQVQQIMEQLSLNIDSYLDELFRLTLAPYHNESIIHTLQQESSESMYDQLQKRRTIEDFLGEIMVLPRRDILQVFIITEQDIYSNERYPKSIDENINPNQYDWYNKALLTQDPIFVPTHMEQMVLRPQTKVFSVVRQIRSLADTEEIIAVMKVDANYIGVQNLINRIDMGEGGGLFILDQNQNVVFSNLDQKDEIPFWEAIKNKNNKEDYVTKILNGESHMINLTELSRTNWSIVAVNSVQALNENASATRDFAVILAFASASLAMIILFFFIRTFLKPLYKIVDLMKEINRGNLEVHFSAVKRDEIGYLGTSFNEMVKKIKEMLNQNTRLVREVYEANYLQKEAQINALFNQIKPHFIFNTLNMISLLVQDGQNEKGIEHINQLSKILRSVTSWNKDIPLEQEIDLLYAYLNIQSTRFKGKIDYTINIDPSFMTYQIPALLLQPLVENAVIHGYEGGRNQTKIDIYSETKDNELLLYVADNGVGMNESRLTEFRKLMAESSKTDFIPEWDGKGQGVGLINVHRRIKMKFGDSYGVTLEHRTLNGLIVSISLPIHSIKKEDINNYVLTDGR